MAAILTGLKQCLSSEFGIPSDIKFLFEKRDDDGSTIIEEVRAHKFILALASDVFKNGFYGGFKDDDSIDITDVRKDVFEAMISFIYGEKTNLSIYDFDMLYSIYYLADKYNITALEEEILEVIKSKEISVESVIDVGVLALQHAVHAKLAEAIYEACAQRLSMIFNGELKNAVEYLGKIDADDSLDLIRHKSVMKIMSRLRTPAPTVCTNCKCSPCLTGVQLTRSNFVQGANITVNYDSSVYAEERDLGIDQASQLMGQKNYFRGAKSFSYLILKDYVFNCPNKSK